MPGTTDSAAPSVTLSFANNFWGKDDAGVDPLLDRMHAAKITGDELKSFYSARAALEEEYARKLLNLARKPLGSAESGTLRMSLDVVRGEVESMGKAHQNIAQQMKTELDEQLSAFAGGMKERRKIVQNGIEKLLKVKTQQTGVVNKARDRYEQDCLKIKGYLAQGHMVMGQEERKNKAKLEKTQIQLSTTRTEYEAAVKVLEETTGRWNRDWKIACDKFQDLEEERIDFMKSSLWSFANIASTVCVSDDAACEKIRLSLEDCDVEKDVCSFIKGSGTGQEIPDPPKFIDFTRGDNSDAASEASEEDNYSVAQFQRTINPAYRSSSPQPSTYESHHDTASDLGLRATGTGAESTSNETTPRKMTKTADAPPPSRGAARAQQMQMPDDIPEVPHNEYPPDGMTQFCRTGPPSEWSSTVSQNRPESRDSRSDYSIPTSFSSFEPSLGAPSPTKQMSDISVDMGSEPEAQKKRSGFFNNRSPFRRKSKGEKDRPTVPPANRNTWGPSTAQRQGFGVGGNTSRIAARYNGQPSPSPEPVDPRATFQLNVGNNVFDVASPDSSRPVPGRQKSMPAVGEHDPIAAALAELKNGAKESASRVSADRYAGLATPAPDSARGSKEPRKTTTIPLRMSRPGQEPDRTRHYGHGSQNGPPSYENQQPQQPQPRQQQSQPQPPPTQQQPAVSRLGAPQPAFTSRQMQQTTQRYQEQKNNMFNTGARQSMPDMQQNSRPSQESRRPSNGQQIPRATSPAPMRSTSPRPGYSGAGAAQQQMRSTSPNPYGANRPRAQSTTPQKPQNNGYGTSPRGAGSSPGHNIPRAVSPAPQYGRPPSSNGASNMALQLAPVGSEPNNYNYGAQPRGRSGTNATAARPLSQYGAPPSAAVGASHDNRVRSKSVAAPRSQQCTPDGRPILHFARAVYMYQAAIPEELSFGKGDMLAILRHQDDGWWEAEVCSKPGHIGLVPSNYLAAV